MAYSQNMAKISYMDDLEENYKIEKMKRFKKSLMSILLSQFIIFLNENLKFIFKYSNINL
jgi:hypothetical protein